MKSNTVATTKLSSKGQVVIPEDIRKRLSLREGHQFVVLGDGDTIILKSIQVPSMNEFSGMLQKARKAARKAGLKKTDVSKAVKAVRSKKR